MITFSLIDRVIDDEPEKAVEPTLSEAEQMRRYKLSLRRDLENLLNTKQPPFMSAGHHGPLEQTMLGYGMTDLSTEDFASAAVRDRLRRVVLKCLRDHEPRLTEVEVEADESPTSRGVRFRITAVTRLADSSELVVYDANVRPSDKTIAIELNN